MDHLNYASLDLANDVQRLNHGNRFDWAHDRGENIKNHSLLIDDDRQYLEAISIKVRLSVILLQFFHIELRFTE